MRLIRYPELMGSRTRLWRGAVLLFVVVCLLSCSSPLAARAADKLVPLAAVFGVSGKAAQNSAPSIDGIRVAVAEINEKGGVLGRELEVVVVDNLSTPIGSKIAVEQADKLGAVAIIGPAWSSNAIAAGREAQARGIPMLSNVATNPTVTRAGDFIFRACFTDDFQGEVMALFARTTMERSKALTFVDITSDYSIGLEKVFRERFESLGGTVLERIPYKVADLKEVASLDDIVDKAAQLAPDVVFIPGHFEAGLIIKGLRSVGINIPIMGGDGWDSGVYLASKGFEGDGVFHCAHWSPDWDNEKTRHLIGKYAETHYLDSGFSLAYDSVYLIVDALERAGSAERKPLRDALAMTRGFDGATGSISFDSFGDPLKSAVILKIEDGKPSCVETISPEASMP